MRLERHHRAGICKLPCHKYVVRMNTKEREFTNVLENNDQVEQLEKAVQEKGREWLQATDEWVHQNPYLALGIAFAAGITIAAIISKRD